VKSPSADLGLVGASDASCVRLHWRRP